MPSGAWNALVELDSLDWTQSSILEVSRSTFTLFTDHQVRSKEVECALGEFNRTSEGSGIDRGGRTSIELHVQPSHGPETAF